ncbi:sigma-54-interacting transcriptional regulator [Azospirillum brasilense]|uniref:Sigma-54-interacting transcriptional regulator n=1 Tax=Azospirillum brasilense TaxID=192 RepID=A0A560AQ75_AZOBR|nr:AraC family transcriptional regulator [Azospirillum brasilense]TWA62526.1 sigma-54-interacting transcriptional regulator [Azospirillum brasilense]
MTVSVGGALDEILHPGSADFRSLPDLIGGLMDRLVDRAPLRGGALWLQDMGTLVLAQDRAGGRLCWTADGDPNEAAADPEAVVVPITYADAPVGEMRLVLDRAPDGAPPEAPILQDVARQCGYLAKRYEVRRWAERRFGRPLMMVGMSPALRELDAFLEQAAHSALPVLLTGEFGTEKAQLAAAIHGCGPRRDGPFVQVNGADPVGTPADWFARAAGGTLFLSGVDEMTPALQGQIVQHMPSQLGQWLDAPGGWTLSVTGPATGMASGMGGPRVIASTTADLRRLAGEGRFSRPLLAELDFLCATVPPLRDRPADIEPLVLAALERHGGRADETRTDELIALCKAHSWPENLFELERVIARLAVMTGGRPIRHGDVRRHAPWMVGGAMPAAPDSGPHPVDHAESVPVASPAPPSADRWVRCALTRDPDALARLHGGLRKALLFLGERFADPITLDELSRQAHVSPSHLSYLFRTELQTSFKGLLGRIRIHKARELLAAERRLPITEVAMSVGYGDLSHFEKSFRRLVGESPREYRRNLTAARG